MYRRLAGWEKYLRNEEPLARVGLVYSQQTAWFQPDGQVREKVEAPGLGWHQALVEARIPFEMVHDQYPILIEPKLHYSKHTGLLLESDVTDALMV